MENTIYTPGELGKICKLFRQRYTTYTQKAVADEVYYSVASISHFEVGTADTASIFQWYISKGLTSALMKALYKELKNAKKL